MLRDSGKTKAVMGKAFASAEDLIRAFETKDAYSWGNHDGVKGELKTMIKQVKDKLGEIGDEVMLQDSKSLAKRFGQDYLIDGLKTFIAQEGEAKKLQSKIDKYRKMQQAS